GGAVVAAAQPQVHDQPILPVEPGRAKGLADHGNESAPVLARRASDELLDPSAEGGEAFGQDDRELVPAAAGERSERGAEPEAGVVSRRPDGAAPGDPAPPPLDHLRPL